MRKKIIIVGGVAGGASAAARARRLSETAEIILIERGKYISFANCGMPYYIGGTIKERQRLLVQTPEKMRKRFNIDVRIRHEVTMIDRNTKTVTIRDLTTDQTEQEDYDQLILSPGASPIIPENLNCHLSMIQTLRNMADMDRIHALIESQKPQAAIVIGGGYIGLEMTEALHQRGVAVTLVEKSQQVMNPIDVEMASLLHQELSLQGVSLKLGQSIDNLEKKDERILAKLSSGETLLTDLVILAIGVRPEISLAQKANLRIGNLGGISVNQFMQTDDPSIYAVGDAIEVQHLVSKQPTLLPLAGPANRQGRIAADHIFGRETSYRDSQGTGICKVFNLSVAMTGLNEKTLKQVSEKYEKIYLQSSDHAGYYPGATPITLKLLFHPDSGKILGAQAIGTKGIDKRIDILSLAVRAGLTVFDLEHVELSYAPPFGAAKDIINYAGFVGSNAIKGDVNICHVEALDKKQQNCTFLDVRSVTEFQNGSIEGAVNIPLDELRENFNKIDKNQEVIVYCKSGLRGYLACRILSQAGYECSNLSGGYEVYLMHHEKVKLFSPIPPLMEKKQNDPIIANKEIDACGLQCPGPILQLKRVIDALNPGEILSITTSDTGFLRDAPAWCQQTGHTLIRTDSEDGVYKSYIQKQDNTQTLNNQSMHPTSTRKKMSIVVFNADFDRAMAAMIIANGAASMGYQPTLFFTFWGLNILRKNHKVKVKKSFVERIFGFMMPRGAEKIALSKLNMAGFGTAMMKNIMRKKNVQSLPDMIRIAQQSDIKLVACSMTMDIMGLKPEELINGVELGGVATYLNQANQGGLNLFI